MRSKAQALEEIVATVRLHGITIEDLQKALSDPTPAGPAQSILVRVFAYLGGILIFAGLVVLILMNWDAMNAAARVTVTLGSGIALFVMGFCALGIPRYEKAATPLLLIGAALQPTGMLVAFDEFSSGGSWHALALTTAGVMILQQGLSFTVRRVTTLLFTTMLFSLLFFGVLFDLIKVPDEMSIATLGFSLLCVCISLEGTQHRIMNPFWYLVGSFLLLYGSFEMLERTPLELLFLGITCLLVYVSTWVRSRTLLAVGTISMLSYIGYFTSQHFIHSFGWPLALILLGLALVAMSAAAFKIDQRYIRR